MWETIRTAFSILVGLGGLGGLVWLSRLAIEKLLNHILERKLTEFKHAQSQEIENLRAELHHLQDRGVRSNELEYQAIIAAWEGFIEAYHSTFGAIGGFRQRPSLKGMSEIEVSEWLETLGISEHDKKYVQEATDKDKALFRVEKSNELFTCQKHIWEAQRIIRQKAVFLPVDIERHFDEALAVLRRVWSENQVNFGTPGSLPLTETIKFLETEEKSGELRTKLRDLVRKRVLHEPRQPLTS
jgi:hypothetical protein